MKDKPLLSICIPTYNRAKYLDEAVESVVSQISEDIKDKVEICISDNASTDDTDEVVEKWKEKSPVPIIYNKNPMNLGADKNYLKVVEIANGEYCWFLGSDDKIVKGGIKFILNEIQSRDFVGIFIFNRYEFSKDFRFKFRISNWFSFKEDKMFNFQKSEIWKYLKYVKRLGGVFSYISSIVFRKNLWEDIDNKDRFVGTLYSHTYILLKMLKRGTVLKYINTPLVACRFNDDDVTFVKTLGNYNRLYIDYWNIIIFIEVFGIDSLEVYYIRKILSNQRNIKSLLALKTLISKNERKKLSILLRNLGFYGHYFFLICVPTSLVNIIRRFYQGLKRVRHVR